MAAFCTKLESGVLNFVTNLEFLKGFYEINPKLNFIYRTVLYIVYMAKKS